MSSSTRQVVPTQRIPAWKRLGLKVKGPAVGSPASASPALHAAPSEQRSEPAAARVNGSGATTPWSKRKENPSSEYAGSDLNASKKTRIEATSTPILRKQKSVAFADDTKVSETTPTANSQTNGETGRQSKAKKTKKSKKKAGKVKQAETNKAKSSLKAPDLEPSLIYLRQWKTVRDSWKFNKNHQTLLVKYLFDCSPRSASGFQLPSTDIDTFYDYIREMVGDIRSRLRLSAENIRKADMVIKKPEAPKEGEVKAPEKTQAEYDQIVSEMLQKRKSMTSGLNSNGKRARRISEVEYVLRVADPDLQKRLIKRIRAENILDELSDSDASSTSAGTTTATTGPSSQDAPDGDAEKKVKLNDGSQQSIKRKRKRKSRDAMLGDDTSSSESESDDDETSSAGSSSSDSSSESSDDEEMPLPPGQADVETSSSSSSSSSGEESEDEFESSEDESGEEDEEESDSDDEL